MFHTKRTYYDNIDQTLEGGINSLRNSRICTKNVINMEEARKNLFVSYYYLCHKRFGAKIQVIQKRLASLCLII